MMPDNKPSISEFDWRVTSFEVARREQLRRWAHLPLEHILLAIEEMQDITDAFGTTPDDRHAVPSQGRGGRGQ